MADNNTDETGEDSSSHPNKRVVVINPDDSRKCELCTKTVYRAEEIKAVDGIDLFDSILINITIYTYINILSNIY